MGRASELIPKSSSVTLCSFNVKNHRAYSEKPTLTIAYGVGFDRTYNRTTEPVPKFPELCRTPPKIPLREILLAGQSGPERCAVVAPIGVAILGLGFAERLSPCGRG